MAGTGIRVKLLAVILAAALVGLAVVQIVMLRKAVASEEDAFQRNAVVALSHAVDALTAGEILRVIVSGAYDSAGSGDLPPEAVDSIIGQLKSQFRTSNASFSWIKQSSGDPGSGSGPDTGRHGLMRIEVETDNVDDSVESGAVPGFGYDYAYTVTSGDGSEASTTGSADSSRILKREFTTRQVFQLPDVADSNRTYLITAALSQLEEQEALPIARRIDRQELDSTIGDALHAEGIDLDYSFSVVHRQSGRPVLVQPGADSAAIAASPFRTRLFPHDILSPPHDLVVYFPAKQAYLLRQLVPVAVPAGLFLLVIAAAFFYTIQIIVRQQGFANRLRDFINNMTHEFKTPISTIQLASEALQRHDVQSDRERIAQFNRMIRDENRRMKGQVDKILQMAVLEDGALEIKHEPVDLHALVTSAAETVKLNIAIRDGHLDSRLEAACCVVSGDDMHLYNVVTNLLDNACKYSEGPPQVRVSTEVVADRILLRIADRGIGLDNADRKRVFERYYRVASGDRHDVKGFGLGLAYVKLVVEAMGGSVRISSTLGKGTEVTVDLPLSKTGERQDG